MRMATIISFTFREAVTDVEYKGSICDCWKRLLERFCFGLEDSFSHCPKRRVLGILAGYLIPKGWKVMPLFRNIHHNPEFFTEPQKFDPSRFEVWWVLSKNRDFFNGKKWSAFLLLLSNLLKILKGSDYKRKIKRAWLIWLYGECRLLQNPIHFCHLAMECIHVLEMSLPS